MTSTKTSIKDQFLEKLCELKATKIKFATRLFNDLTKKHHKPDDFFTSYDFVNHGDCENGVFFTIHHCETRTTLRVTIPEGFPFHAPIIQHNEIILNTRWNATTRLLRHIENCRQIKSERKSILIGANNTSAADVTNAVVSGYDIVVDYCKIASGHQAIPGVKADFTKAHFWETVFEGFKSYFPDSKIYRISFDWSVYKFVWNDIKQFYGSLMEHTELVDEYTSMFVPYGTNFVPGYVYNISIDRQLVAFDDTHNQGLFQYDDITKKLKYTPQATTDSFVREFPFLFVNLPVKNNYETQKVPFLKSDIIAHNTDVFMNFGFRYVIHHKETMYPVNRSDHMQREIKSFYELQFK